MNEKKIPNHIAFIMDGNGRWAKTRLMPRKYGHKHGVEAMQRVISACKEIGVKEVSIYAFSTENWARPKEEVDELFRLVKQFADEELPKYAKDNYKVRFMGEIDKLPVDVISSLKKISEAVKDNTGTVINIGLNYGGRDEIVRAVNKLIADGKSVVKESDISDNLDTYGLSDPDVIVRSAGEKRLSNFMLWQSAYSEYIYIDDYWPDFNKSTVEKIVKEYATRERKYGNIRK